MEEQATTPAAVSAPLFALPRLATSFVGTGIVTLALPQMVVAAVGDAQKGLHLGSITAAASIASLAALYVSGVHSDRSRLGGGRRGLPVLWLSVMLVPLLVLALGATYPIAVGAVVALAVARSLCDAAHLPIIADDFREASSRRAGIPASATLSAHIAFQQFLGAALGALAFAMLPWTGGPSAPLRTGVAPAAVPLLIMAMIGFRRSYLPLHRAGPQPKANGSGGAASAQPAIGRAPAPGIGTDGESTGGPLISASLRNLLAARTLFMAGVFIISTFLVFLVRDVLGAADVERITAILFGGTLVGALATALPAGRVAAKFGDRRMLVVAGLAVGMVAPAFLAFAPGRPAIAVVCMLLYGGAFGIVVTSGLSLTLAVVGDPARAGRVMALASATTFLAQAIASVTGAVLLDPLNWLRPNAGYAGLVVLIEVLLVAGGWFLMRIELVPSGAEVRSNE